MSADLMHQYTEVFVVYRTEEDATAGRSNPHFQCSVCGQDVTDLPCPDHAPMTDLPGRRLVDCTATPRHYIWSHKREDYGHPCPQCIVADNVARDLEARACRHWGWRRWRLTHRIAGFLYSSGITTGGGSAWGNGHDWCLDKLPSLRGKRSYVLGFSTNTWRCWLRGRHRRGEEVGFGFCGKCAPWPCCGAKTFDHASGCREAA